MLTSSRTSSRRTRAATRQLRTIGILGADELRHVLFMLPAADLRKACGCCSDWRDVASSLFGDAEWQSRRCKLSVLLQQEEGLHNAVRLRLDLWTAALEPEPSSKADSPPAGASFMDLTQRLPQIGEIPHRLLEPDLGLWADGVWHYHRPLFELCTRVHVQMLDSLETAGGRGYTDPAWSIALGRKVLLCYDWLRQRYLGGDGNSGRGPYREKFSADTRLRLEMDANYTHVMLGDTLFSEGRSAECVEAMRAALPVLRACENDDWFGESGRATQRVIKLLGVSLHKTGRGAEAISLLRGLLEVRRAKLGGADEQDVLETMDDLAFALSGARRWAEAIETWRGVVELSTRLHGATNETTLDNLAVLADWLKEGALDGGCAPEEARASLREATALLRKLIAVRGAVRLASLGPAERSEREVELLDHRIQLAYVLSEAGEADEADELLRRAHAEARPAWLRAQRARQMVENGVPRGHEGSAAGLSDDAVSDEGRRFDVYSFALARLAEMASDTRGGPLTRATAHSSRATRNRPEPNEESLCRECVVLLRRRPPGSSPSNFGYRTLFQVLEAHAKALVKLGARQGGDSGRAQLREAVSLLDEAVREQRQLSAERSAAEVQRGDVVCHTPGLMAFYASVTQAELAEALIYLGEMEEAAALMAEVEAVYAEHMAPLGSGFKKLGLEPNPYSQYIHAVRALLGVARAEARNQREVEEALGSLERQVDLMSSIYWLGEEDELVRWARAIVGRARASGSVAV